MFRKFALSGAALLALVIAAWAATVPVVVHKNAAGIDEDSLGVVLIDKDTGNPYNASAAGSGGDATAANQVSGNTKLDTLHTDNTTLLGRYPAALGGATAANSFPVVLSSDGPFATQTGAITETSPATDTASSGLNGRLQRIAQRLTSLIAQIPASLGIKTTANSMSVTLPSDISFGSAVSLTRTNDTNAYTANDVVGAATGSTAALTFTVGAGAGEYTITSASLEIDAAAVIASETNYILYLYNVTPPSALGDNAAWDLPSGDRASYLGAINLGAPADLGSTLSVEQSLIGKQITLASGNLFAYLVTVGAYTPTASRVHVITLHTVKTQ